MTTTETQKLIVRLRERARVEPQDITSWLMNSKSRLAFDKNNFSVHNAEYYVYEDTDVIEQYDDAHYALARAIGYCWEADKHSALILIERLMTLLEYDYEGRDVDYSILLTKLSLMRFILHYTNYV